MRWKCICSYKGTAFGGWQFQPSGSGVQNHFESALGTILDQPTRIHGCSRTDAGVHAYGQCFHFDGDWPHSKDKLKRALHSLLNKDIRIEKLTPVSQNFHARFSAVKKSYVYTLYLDRAPPAEADFVWACRDTPIDFPAMLTASQIFIGQHDFTAFSAVHAKDNDPNPIKEIHSLELKQKGAKITITITGSGFLYKMVRSIVGTLYAVGRNRIRPDEVLNILHSKKRTNKVVTAPASGLSLKKIFYK
jgi:tRNA pseudouridine38-40 synthase